MKLTKKELIDRIADKTKLTKDQARIAFDQLVNELVSGLIKGDSVELRKLFVLKVKTSPARTGVFPQSGQPKEIPEHRVVQVKLSNKLKKAVW